MIGLIGKKLGMTRIFTNDGISIPISVIEVIKNVITQIKTNKIDGYNAIQLSAGRKKVNHIKKPEMGHYKKSGVEVGIILREFHVKEIDKFTLGQTIDIMYFKDIKKVDITGISKGKGFAGTIKRWNFASQDASHGNSLSHRVPGSIGQNQTPGKVFKGKKMPGRLGNTQVTTQNLEIIRIDIQRNLLLIKGSIPGSIGGNIIIKPAIKYPTGEQNALSNNK
uniref:Large ribosomal subunit protein uL3 n=1 Tax=Candidatus Aschnera chinzeii TaxID=1485666 RepID=A0AAT9G484_9ENTR|nr:MAG: 50S ribosomal protein L3 [Candidatus Aschnera chinzeii]